MNEVCVYCGAEIVAKSVFPGIVWTTLAEEANCERDSVGHMPQAWREALDALDMRVRGL